MLAGVDLLSAGFPGYSPLIPATGVSVHRLCFVGQLVNCQTCVSKIYYVSKQSALKDGPTTLQFSAARCSCLHSPPISSSICPLQTTSPTSSPSPSTMFRFTTLTIFALAATFVAAQDTSTTSPATPDASGTPSTCIVDCSTTAATAAGCTS